MLIFFRSQLRCLAIKIDRILSAVRHHILRRSNNVAEKRIPRILRRLHVHTLVIAKATDPGLSCEVHIKSLDLFLVGVLDQEVTAIVILHDLGFSLGLLVEISENIFSWGHIAMLLLHQATLTHTTV